MHRKNLNDDNDIEGRCSDVHEDTGHNDDNTCIYLTNGCQENTKPESEEVLNDRDFDGIHTYHGQLVCSDQSEEGSLTDSDRTLLGSLPRLNGECQGSNASNPETLPVLIDSNHSSDKSENSSYVSFCEFEQTLSSPEDNSREFTKYQVSDIVSVICSCAVYQACIYFTVSLFSKYFIS